MLVEHFGDPIHWRDQYFINVGVYFNWRNSFQLFVMVFDRCLVWHLLVLPSKTHAVVANMTSLRAIDGDTSNHLRESSSL